MKSITRLYLSKNKQRVLSAVRRINDARNDLVIDSHYKQEDSDDELSISKISIVEVIEDRYWNNLRVSLVAAWKDTDALSCTASAAFGRKQTCKAIVIAKRAIDSAIDEDGRALTRLLVTIQLPKRISSYAISLVNGACPEIAGKFVFRESDYGRMLHECGMLTQSAENDFSYPEWFFWHKASEAVLDAQRTSVLASNPIFSIIVPLFKTPLDYFNDMVQSVLAQSYPYWQLILVNASPEIEELTEAVAEIADSDERITVVTLEENLGITLNTNEGMKAAIGDFISFFDHDDTIEPDILFEYASAINAHPETDVLYCDEDKLTPNGEYMHPFLKPDYSPDLLHCHNYICHMLTVRASILKSLEPAGAEVDGAQDYNCVLRATEKARYVHHVRRVLYHWRINPTSVANDSTNKPYATRAGMISLERHFERLGIDASIDLRKVPFRYYANYTLDEDDPITIIIPSCDDYRLLDTCITSIANKTTYANYEVIIVDCGTTDEKTLTYYEAIAEKNDRFSVIKLANDEEANSIDPALAFECGVAHAKGEFLVFLSHDVQIITPSWLDALRGYFQHEYVGCVGGRIMCADETVFHAGIAIGGNDVHYLNQNSTISMFSYFGLRDDVQNVSAVSPSFMMTRKSLFADLGGFDPSFIDEYQGIDYCLRLRKKGKYVVYTPLAEVYRHDPYPQFGCDDAAYAAKKAQNISLFKQRWASYYTDGDPFYSINFQQLGPEGRFYHLGRDYGLTVVLNRHGIEYFGYATHPNE
ncbi:MAG: glycosyltransferase [Eggerthellaceae bacterium]|nr:glycosyltransferase [Eggerthellaceae bacterium]